MEEIEEQLGDLGADENCIEAFRIILKDKTFAFKKELLKILVEKKL